MRPMATISGWCRVANQRAQLAANNLLELLITACQPLEALKAVASVKCRVARKAPTGPRWVEREYSLLRTKYFVTQSAEHPTRMLTPATRHYPLLPRG
jgi:hypothetical protein